MKFKSEAYITLEVIRMKNTEEKRQQEQRRLPHPAQHKLNALFVTFQFSDCTTASEN